MARFVIPSMPVGGKSPPENDGRHVAVSSDGGATWSLSLLPDGQTGGPVAWNGSVWAIIPGNGGTSAYSDDGGATWVSGGTLSAVQWQDVAAHGGTGRFVAVSEGGDTAYSDDDGATWIVGGSTGITSARSIACNGRVFCVVGFSDTVSTSPDGETWTTHAAAQTTSSTAPMKKIITVTETGRFVVGDYNPGLPRCQYSDDDGATWQLSGIIPEGTHSMNVVACDGHTRVLVGDTDGYVGVSNDGGVTFAAYTDPLVYGARQSSQVGLFWSFACDGAQFVLLHGNVSDYAVTTPDGITYTARTLPVQTRWHMVASDLNIIASLAVVPSSASMALGVGVPTVASSSVLVDVAAASMQLYAGTPLVSASMRLDVASASMLLAAGVPHVSTGAVSAFKSTDGSALPLKVWNGSGWVDVPLRLWDGSTFLN